MSYHEMLINFELNNIMITMCNFSIQSKQDDFKNRSQKNIKTKNVITPKVQGPLLDV